MSKVSDPRQMEDVSVEEHDKIDYVVEDLVGTITFNDPENYNALSFDMMAAVVDAVEKAQSDDDVKAIVLKGAEGTFCPGHDLAQPFRVYEAYDGEEAGERRPSERARLDFDSKLISQYETLLNSHKPIIAQVEGWCIGAGMFINLVCDLTIAAESAKFSHREQRLVFAGAGAMLELLYLQIGPKQARELLLTGRTVDGEEAVELGLANEVVPDDEIEDEVERYCEAIKLQPRDGLVMSGMSKNLAYENLGIAPMTTHNIVMHTLGTNIRFEEDEYNFIGSREQGLGQAIEKLHERYDDLGFN